MSLFVLGFLFNIKFRWLFNVSIIVVEVQSIFLSIYLSSYIYIYIYITEVGDPKAPFSTATTPRYRGGH